MHVMFSKNNNKSEGVDCEVKYDVNCGFKNLKNAGFTLIELIVVLAIFAVIMGVALFNQTGLNSNILITNLAYETALAVREAQTYGIGVRATASSSATSDFDKGYGAYFDMSTSDRVIVFGDSNNNGMYDPVITGGIPPTELESMYQIQNQRGNNITKVCVFDSSNNCTALAVGDGVNGQTLSIMFKRPNPEATFHVFNGVGGELKQGSLTGPAVITVNNSTGNNCRSIVVEVTGQIRVENATSPGNTHCTNPNP